MTIDTQTKISSLDKLLKEVPRQIESLRSMRETFLTDAVLLGEIPSPTFGERDRIRLVIDRFRENGLQKPALDEFGNASGIIQGSVGNSTILIMAHADSVFSADTRHVLEVGSDYITGPGIADNAIGLASVVTLPKLLSHLNIELKDDLLLVANVKSLGRANMEGTRGFLETMSRPTKAGICRTGRSIA